LSIQFGRWNLDGRPTDPALFERVRSMTAPYDISEPFIRYRDDVGMLVHAPHSFGGSRPEAQSPGARDEVLLSWDGRLDNRDEIGEQINATPQGLTTDAEFVQAAYQQWGLACFRNLVGDWALAIWDPPHKRVVLARDFAGVRQLYFDRQMSHISWCTVLDPLLHLRGRGFDLSEEYLVGYLSTLPPGHLTPFLGVSAVAPGTFVVLEVQGQMIRAFWKFDPSLRTRYLTDAEYEEHFRNVFRKSVKRRLRSNGTAFAELSGGMDSSSIVCMADAVISQDGDVTSPLETISYYDNSEPNWNESPYFSIVEHKRGRTGKHLDMGTIKGFLLEPEQEDFCLLPGRDRFTLEIQRLISECMPNDRESVLLSGLGGDEFLGGVPNPVPELQDMFVRLKWAAMLRRLSRWSLEKRRPWPHLCFEVAEEFLPQPVRRLYRKPRVPPWVRPSLRKNYRNIFEAQMKPVSFWMGPPSFQANVNTFEHISRQISCYAPSRCTRFGLAYPYLDRDLLEFLFSIPRDQILRPGQRRSLMRRALSALVPEQILQRRRKAYVSRSPVKTMQESLPAIQELFRSSLAASRGIIEDSAFLAAMERALGGEIDWLSALIATVKLEQWLRGITKTNLTHALGPGRRISASGCQSGKRTPHDRPGERDDLTQLSRNSQ